MTRLLLALALLIPTIASAGPDRVYVMAGSKHLNTIYEFNEINPGIFLTWEESMLDFTVGGYINSYSKTSLAVSVAYPILRGENYSVDVFAGLATYFDTSRPDILPMAGIQGRLGPMFVQYIPTPGNYVDGIVSFGMTFDLN